MSARTPGSERPRRLVCLVDAGTGDDAARGAACLLADFSDALGAYSRASERASGGRDAAPETVWIDGAGPENGTALPCDALVCALSDQEDADDILRGALSPAATGARVYAIAASAAHDGSRGGALLDRLASICPDRDLRWSGGLVVTDADLVPRLMRAPRLGAWRRPVSEAIDQLVAAVRMDCPLSVVDRLLAGRDETERGGAGGSMRIAASPAALWRLAMRGTGRR